MIARDPGLDSLGWSLEPGVLVPLALAALLYARGTIVLGRRGRGVAIRPPQVVSFAAGWLVVALALVSPLHDASERLFSAHMVQHELLMAVAAPLLALGRPMIVMLWSLPARGRRVIGRATRLAAVRAAWAVLARPADAWLIHGVAIWAWHMPALFEAALRNETIHALQHACFLGSALLFWWSVVHGQRRAARGVAVVYLFTTAVHTGVLGALMTFARAPWYPAYAGTAPMWGITPMADQQLAGLIMWVPSSVAYLIAALAIMMRWLRDSEWAVTQRERAPSALTVR